MGCVRKVEQAAVRTLMAEFARLQVILGEDLTRSLSALCLELEASSESLAADVLDVLSLRPGDLGFSWVKELLLKHHQSVSLKVNLPLIELEAAKGSLRISSCRTASVSWAPGHKRRRYWGRSLGGCWATTVGLQRSSKTLQMWSDPAYATGLCSPLL